MKTTQQEYIEKRRARGDVRINAWIKAKNYDFINKLMKKDDSRLFNLDKGLILDIALSNLSTSLESGESLNEIIIKHLQRCENQ